MSAQFSDVYEEGEAAKTLPIDLPFWKPNISSDKQSGRTARVVQSQCESRSTTELDQSMRAPRKEGAYPLL